MKKRFEKTFPKVGDKCYIRQYTGSYYIDLCKRPYTVVGVSKSRIQLQECGLVFLGDRYYDTLPDAILPNSSGRIIEMTWHPTKGKWGEPNRSYPEFAVFGEGWQYFPYLD